MYNSIHSAVVICIDVPQVGGGGDHQSLYVYVPRDSGHPRFYRTVLYIVVAAVVFIFARHTTYFLSRVLQLISRGIALDEDYVRTFPCDSEFVIPS